MDVKKNIKFLILGKRNKNVSYNFLQQNLNNNEMMDLKKNFSSNNSLKLQNVKNLPIIQKLNHSIQLNKDSYNCTSQFINGNLRKINSESKFQNISLKKEKSEKKNHFLLHNIIESHFDNSYIKEQKIIKKLIMNNKKGNREINKDMTKLYNRKTKRENLNIYELNFFKNLERKFLENEYEKIINRLKEKRKKENEERIKNEKTKRMKKLIQIKKISNTNNNDIPNLIIKNSLQKNLLNLNDQETQTNPFDFFNVNFS